MSGGGYVYLHPPGRDVPVHGLDEIATALARLEVLEVLL